MRRSLNILIVLLAAAIGLTACGGGGGGGSSTGTTIPAGTNGSTSNGTNDSSSAPAPVGGFTVVAASRQISTSWAAVTGATDYEVEIATSSDFNTGRATAFTNSTSHLFPNLQNGKTYYLRIRSTQGTAYSAYSATVTATPNYMSGWNTRDEIGRQADDVFTDLYARSDSMNSKRDVLSSWAHGGSSGSTVYANTYTAGNGWATQQVISSSGSGSNSSLSENGEGAIVWVERTYLDAQRLTWNDEVRVKHYQAGTWGAAQTLSGTEGGSWVYEPTVMLDKDGHAVAAWHGANGHYFVRTYDRGTNTWSTVRQLSTNANTFVGRVQMGVAANGGFVLAWNEGTLQGGSGSVFVGRYSHAGGWTSPEPINVDDPALKQQNSLYSLSVNGSGDIFVLWEHLTDATNMQVLLRKYSASGAAWGSAVTVDTSNFALDWGTVKSDPAGNAIVYWKKRTNNGGTTVESNNFAVYSAGAMEPTQSMLQSDYDIVTVDVVATGTGGFRMIYGQSGPVHAYQRIYDFAAKSWSAPTIIGEYFGNDGYIATTNSAGEILLTSGFLEFNSLTFDQSQLVVGSFFLP